MTPTAGSRFVEHEHYLAARDAGHFRARHLPYAIRAMDLLTGPELRSALRLRTSVGLEAFDIDGVPFPAALASAAMLPGVVETIPVDRVQVYEAQELVEDVEAGAVPPGAPLPETNIDFGAAGNPVELPRFGSAAPVTLDTLDDAGLVQAVIDLRMRRGFPLGLEREILTGGSGQNTGILQLPTNATGDDTHAVGVDKTTGAYTFGAEALNAAVGLVQTNGWYERPLQIISSPNTRANVFNEATTNAGPIRVSEMFGDQVDQWLVTNKGIPDGTAIVGDLFEAVALFQHGPLEAGLAPNQAGFLTRGMVEMTLATRLKVWLRRPAALAIVTSLDA